MRDARESDLSLSSTEVLDKLLSTFEAVRPGRVCTASAGDRCMARVWCDGLGGQCHKGKMCGSDYCKTCAKKAKICSIPASFTEDGKHKGLFWGRVDEERPEMSADGIGLAIMWRDEEGKKSAREMLESDGCDGWHPFCTQPGCRTNNWKAPLKTTLPRKKKGAKKKKKKSGPRIRTAKERWLKKMRPQIRGDIIKLSVNVKKFPSAVVFFYIDAEFDVEAATATIKGMSSDKWADYCEEHGPFTNEKYAVDEAGNFSGEIKGNMLLGSTSKAGAAKWKSLGDEEQEVYETEYLKEKADKEAVETSDLSDDGVVSSDSDCEEKAKPKKKAKKKPTTKKKSKTKKKPVIKKPPTPSPSPVEEEVEEEVEEVVEEEVEEVEVSLGEDDIVRGIQTEDGLIDAYVDAEGTAFDMDGEELGEYNSETNEIE